MKRPESITVSRPGSLPDSLARQASYLGSSEHRTSRWWGGLPQARLDRAGNVRSRPKKQHTTPCPLVTEADRSRATEWVRTALRQGQFRFVEGDGEFPKHIWHTDENGQRWLGMCVNRTTGEYKGWPDSGYGRR